MSTFTGKTGLQILESINRLKTNYGMNNLSKTIWQEIDGSSIPQAKDLILQLIEKGFLKEMNIGTDFAMFVIALTDKGKEAIHFKEDIALDFKRFYANTFKPASDIGVVDKDILEEYYTIKKELMKLNKREEELKDTIKKAMTEKNVREIHSEFMDLYCKKIERILYPKYKIERFVPAEIIEKIKTVTESIVLTARLKKTEE